MVGIPLERCVKKVAKQTSKLSGASELGQPPADRGSHTLRPNFRLDEKSRSPVATTYATHANAGLLL